MARPAHILVVPDKFKGTLSAAEACTAITDGWKSVRRADQLDLLPMSDGGDGFGEVMAGLLGARARAVKTLDAAHRPLRTHWWWVAGKKLAIIEAARVNGLALLPPGKFHPFQLDTFGLGKVFEEAERLGAAHCIIGIGGSATNDGGFGLARAVGWKFLDRDGRELDQWWQLSDLVRVQPPAHRVKMRVTVAVDVTNPLLGPRGCTRVYGPQKGIRPVDIAHAEKCLRRMKTILAKQLNLSFATTPGAGAAGGLGFGLMTFARAKPCSGFKLFADTAQLESRIRNSDLVITGEGAIDQQTRMGKGTGQVMQLCRMLETPCIALAGIISANAGSTTFCRTFTLTDITTLEQAKSRPAFHLQRLAAKIAKEGF